MIQQLLLNNNKELEKKILNVLLKIYSQREAFAHSLKDLLLLFDQKSIENYERSRKKLIKLQKFAETAETWLNLKKGFDMDILKKTRETVLFFYNSLLGTKAEDEELEYDLSRVKKENVNVLRQDMYRNLKIHIPIISLIRDSINIIESNTDPQVSAMFQYCFGFLTAFVFENRTNQLLMVNTLNLFQNTKFDPKIGHIKMITELFKDNEELCNHHVEEVIDAAVAIIEEDGRKTEYLDFFKIIQSVKGELIYNNQRLVLDIFLDSEFKAKSLYLDMSDQNPVKKFEFREKLMKNDEPFYYHAELLNLLSMTAAGKEGLVLNEIRLRSAIDFTYLISLLLEPDEFTKSTVGAEETDFETPPKEFEILKIPIVSYIYYVYVESEKYSDELAQSKDNMGKLLLYEQDRIVSMTACKPQYYTYFFELLLEMIHWYFKSLRNIGESKSEREITTYRVNDFCKTLKSSITKFDHAKISRKGRDHFYALFKFSDEEDIPSLELVPAYRKLAKIESKKKSVTMKVAGEMPEEDIWKKIWEEFVSTLLKSETLAKYIDNEKKMLAKVLLRAGEFSNKIPVLKDIVNKEEAVKKLTNFIQDNEYDDETRETFILILECLGNFIENEADEEKQIEKQNFLTRQGAVTMAFGRLCDPDLETHDVFFKALTKFMIKLLEGGNNEVQRNIYRYFLTNSDSQEFF